MKNKNLDSSHKIVRSYDLKSGFTLIEIMVALTILSLVFAVIITASGAINQKGRDQKRITDLQSIQQALSRYYADQNYYPLSLTPGSPLQGPTPSPNLYLNPIPYAPTNGTAYCYRPVADQNNGGCDNSLTPCQYYHLCAYLEITSSNANCFCNSSTYNFEVNPSTSFKN